MEARKKENFLKKVMLCGFKCCIKIKGNKWKSLWGNQGFRSWKKTETKTKMSSADTLTLSET